MDSRPGETSTTADLLAALPQEIQLEIFNLANLQTLGRMQQTSSYYNYLLMDNKFWDSKQTKQLTPTPFFTDNKNQYHAELLYQRAMSTANADKKQIDALKLRRFLQQQFKPWSHYYHGLSLFKGLGVKVDRTIGLAHLLDALDIEDYRAAIIIARLLVETKIGDPELFQQLMSSLNNTRLQLMHALILNVHKKKIAPVAKLLGRLHAHGIGVEANFSMVEKYYFEALTHVTNDMAELARLKFDSLSTSLSYEQKAAATIAYLKTFLGKLSDAPLQSVINYWSAYLELMQGNRDTAISLLNNALELPCANIFLSHLLAENGMLQPAALHLIDLTNTNEDITGDLFDLQIQFSTLQDAITETRKRTKCHLIELADRVSAIYRREMDMITIACDPDMVWWLQLAAQGGCVHSLEALQSVDAKVYPYICYALAIIYEFGILHSEVIGPNHDKAEYYFNLARNVDLEIYLLTSQGDDFACKEVIDLLQVKMNASVRKSV